MDIRKSKITRHLKSIEQQKINSFSIFLASAFHNSNPVLPKLLKGIQKYWPKFDDPNFNLDRLHTVTYGKNKIINYSKINRALFDLNLLLLQFLATSEFLKSKDDWLPYTIEALQQYPKNRETKALLKEQIKRINKNEYYDISDYLALSKCYKHFYEISIEEDNIGDLELFKEYKNNLNKYYHLENLTSMLSLLSRNQLLEKRTKNVISSATSKFALLQNIELEPIFHIFLLILEIYKGKSVSQYHEIKNLYYKHINKISPTQRHIIQSCLSNFTYNRIKSGDSSFLMEQFSLYKHGLSIQIYGEQKLSAITFMNIVVASSLVKEINFANDFIKQYKNRLTKEDKNDAVLISKAFIAFHEEKIEHAYKMLVQVKSDKVHFHLRSSTLTLRCLYEFSRKDQSIENTLKSRTVALERVFKRDTSLSSDNVEAYLNFISTLRSLSSKTAINKTKEFKTQALKKLNSYENIIAKSWLEKKILELKDRD